MCVTSVEASLCTSPALAYNQNDVTAPRIIWQTADNEGFLIHFSLCKKSSCLRIEGLIILTVREPHIHFIIYSIICLPGGLWITYKYVYLMSLWKLYLTICFVLP